MENQKSFFIDFRRFSSAPIRSIKPMSRTHAAKVLSYPVMSMIPTIKINTPIIFLNVLLPSESQPSF